MLCESGIDLDFDVFEEEQDRNYFEVKSKCLTPASNNPFVLMDLDLINVKPDPDAAANGGMGGAYGNTRANFKLHLQREHLIEEERKKVKYKHNVEAMQMFQQSNAMSFPQPPHQQQQQRTSPMKTLPSNLPTSVLKVETKLQNPTQYYIKQQQKRQVRDYLNQQQQQQNQRGGGSGGSGGPTMPVSAPSSLRNQQMFDFPSPPVTGYHSTSSHLSPASPDTTSSVASGGEVENTVFEDFLGLENNFGEEFGMFSDNMFPSTLPATNNLFETFAVAHNQNEKDEKISSSCPITVKQENPDGFVKDRQKKDNHNLIERRRRYNINDRIKELGTLVPKMDNDFKQNKGTILKSSVDYIRRLKKDRERMRMYEMRNMTLEDLNKKLSLRVQELELILRASNLSTILPEPSLAGNSSGNTPANHLAQLLQQQHQQQNNQQKYPSDLHRLLTKPSHSAPLPGTSSETVATTLSTSVDSPRFMDEEPIDTD